VPLYAYTRLLDFSLCIPSSESPQWEVLHTADAQVPCYIMWGLPSLQRKGSQSAGWWSLSLACRGQAVSLPVQGLPSLVTAAQSPSSTYPVSSNNLRLYGMTVCYLTAITDGKNTNTLSAFPLCREVAVQSSWSTAGALLGLCASSQYRQMPHCVRRSH